MNVSGIRRRQLSIYCSIEEHDVARRREFMEQLLRLGISAEFHGDKIEVHYRGDRDIVMKLASYADSHLAHSINISGA